MMKRVGMITIGQSPRVDVVPEVMALVDTPMEVVEAGALDGLNLDEVRRMAPGPNDETLVTRMADGTGVHVAKRHIIPRLQSCIDHLAPRVEVVVLLCTGIFPEFHSSVPVLEPQRLVDRVVQAVVSPGGQVGLMIPAAAQAQASRRKMEEYGLVARVAVASPYGRFEEVRHAAATFRDSDVKAVVMHCIGYDAKMKAEVRQQSGKPVILARSVVGKILEEML
ncbi:MAG TPA: AroM family protein [archaeon]|nr:AroM family protein [archaeon]